MLSPLLALAMALAPVAPPGTQQALVVLQPKTGLPHLRAFLDPASKLASALAPGPLGLELGSAISVDLFDVGAWEAAGLDAEAPLTLASGEAGVVLLVGVKDAKKLLARARTALGAAGTVTSSKLKGSDLLEAHHPGAAGPVLGGAMGVRGRWAALLVRGESTRWLIAALEAHPFAAMEHAKGLTGDAWLVATESSAPSLVIGLTPSASQLGIDGRAWGAAPVVKLPARDAFADLHPPGIVWGHLDTAGWALKESKAELASWTHFLVLQVCRDCSTKPEEQLAATLVGPVAFVATRLAPEQSHSTHDLDRYFMVPEVEAAQVGDPVAAHTALGALLDDLRAHQAAAESVALPRGEHYQLRLGKGRVAYFGLVGQVLYLANTEDARTALLGSMAEAPTPPTHAGVLHLDCAAASHALSKLSIFDAAASPDLGALFGVAVEASPLLRGLGDVELGIDVEGSAARLRGTLRLPPPGP